MSFPAQARPTPPPVRRKKRRSHRAKADPILKRNKTRPQSRRRLPIRRELSAGGVAVRQEGDNLLVAILKTEHKRGEVWVLPKGHVELQSSEKVSEAAKREVEEEAGLTDLSVKDQLGITRFRFQVEDAVVHKTVHYFLMMTNQKKLVPQAEEGMIDAAWVPISEAIQKLEYDTDQDIVARARQKLTGEARPQIFPSKRPTRTRTRSRRLPKIHR